MTSKSREFNPRNLPKNAKKGKIHAEDFVADPAF